MNKYKYKLITIYRSGNYVKWLEVFNEYVEKGYGIDYETLKSLAIVYSKLGKFDDAIRVIKLLEKSIDKYNIHEEIAQLYFLCRKPKEALRIYNLMTTKPEKNGLLVRILLLNGKFEEASNIVDSELLLRPNDEIFLDFKYKLDNHNKLGSYIETEYSCFKELGNTLMPGHIVFLYDAPTLCNSGKTINDSIKRPYLIWKIEGDNIYLFPVCANCRDQDYRLYLQKYPNSIGDRRLIDEIYKSSIDNIYSVEDKVFEDDFYNLLSSIFYKLYYRKDEKEHPEIYSFLKYIKGEPKENDVIEIKDMDTNKHYYYFVLEDNGDSYKTILIDYLGLNILSSDIVNIKKDVVYYSIKNLIKPHIDLVRERYEELDKNKGLTLS